MKKRNKIMTVILVCLLAAAAVFSVSCDRPEEGSELDIAASLFVPYDFARTVFGERATVTQLLPPGGEGHDWEPPAKLLSRVASADLFIYVGGGSDSWAERLLSSADIAEAVERGSLRVLCLSEHIDVSGYYTDEGHGHSHDAHYWTSPRLAKSIASAITEEAEKLDPENADYYSQRGGELVEKLRLLDDKYFELKAMEGRLFFGDKFAFYYLCREYDIDYISPYVGCTEDAQPIDKKVVEIKEEMKEAEARIVFCEEYNSADALVNSIAEECGVTVKELHSCHNLNKSDMDSGLDYITLMERNLALILEALASEVK